jgi:hypothetical protein
MSIKDKIQAATQTAVDSFSDMGTDATPVVSAVSTPSTPSPTPTSSPVDPTVTVTEGVQGGASTPSGEESFGEDLLDDYKAPWEVEGKNDNPNPQGAVAGEDANKQAVPATGGEEQDFAKLPPKELEAAFLRTERGRRQYQHWKGMRDLQMSPNEDGTGGIGFLPTPQDIKSFWQSHESFGQMRDDWESGEPERMGDVLNAFLEVDKSGQPTELALKGVEILTQSLPPALFKPLAIGIVDQYVQDLIQRSQDQTKSELDRKHYKALAESLEEDILGTRKRSIDPATLANDPLREERQRLETERQSIQTQQQAQKASVTKKVSDFVSNQRVSANKSAIDSALSQFAKAYEPDPIAHEGIRQSFISEVKSSMNKNLTLQRNYTRALDAAKRSGNKADADTAVTQYQIWLAQSIRQTLPKYRTHAAQQTASSASAQHATGTTSQTSSGTPAGQATPQSIVPPSARQKGQSNREFFESKFRSVNV